MPHPQKWPGFGRKMERDMTDTLAHPDEANWSRVLSGRGTFVSMPMIDVRLFGEVGSGVRDDRALLQQAIAYGVSIGGGQIYLPSGTYLCEGADSPDGLLNGLLLPFHPTNGSAGVIRLVGDGKATVLRAAAPGMALVRMAGDFHSVENLTLDAGGQATCVGLALVPEDMTQTTTLVSQNHTLVSGLLIQGFAEGVMLKTGPDVGGADSSCYYNTIQRSRITYCTRGVWLRSGPAAGASPCNRNQFDKLVIGQTCNTGFHIESGDTTRLIDCKFEGILAGTSPSATPTGVVIDALDAWGTSNEQNALIGCHFEACGRDLENNVDTTNIVATGIGSAGGTHSVPALCLGGAGPSVMPQRIGDLLYQMNSQLPDNINGFNWRWDHALHGGRVICDYDADGNWLRWDDIALTTSNVGNVSSIAEGFSYWQQVSGLVHWTFRLQFIATVATNAVTIALPLTPSGAPVLPHTEAYRQFGFINAMAMPLSAVGASGASAVVQGRFPHHADSSNRLTVSVPAGNWDTVNAFNAIYGMITYKAAGYTR